MRGFAASFLFFLFFGICGTVKGSDWTIAEVDTTAGTGVRSSTAVTSEGNPCISYYDSTAKQLKYAWKDSEGWHVTAAGGESGVGEYNSLILTSDDKPRISYYDAVHQDLRFAFKNGQVWSTEMADGIGTDVGQYSCLAIDGQGNPWISFYNATEKTLSLTNKELSTWKTTIVDGPGGDVGRYSSLKITADGKIGISYYDAGNQRLKYTSRITGGTWVVEIVGATGRFNCLAINSEGQPYISYYDEASQSLKLANKTGAGWVCQTIDGGNGVDAGRNNVLVLDRNGQPQICYLDSTNQTLKFASKTDEGWKTQTIGNCGTVENSFSMVLDRSGRPHISFCRSGSQSLGYATIPDQAPQTIDDAVTIDEDTAVDIRVLENDTDADHDPIALVSATQGSHGTVTINSAGIIRYTPEKDFYGTDIFSYKTTDGVMSNAGKVTVTVRPINDLPKVTLSSPTAGTFYNASASVKFTCNATDTEGNVQKVEFYQGSTLLGSSTQPPFTFDWENVPAGNYSVTAKAYDEAGEAGSSELVTFTVKDQTATPSGDGQEITTPSGGCAAMGMGIPLLLLCGIFSLTGREK